MRAFYRLQQHVALTQAELSALSVLSLLFLGGLLAQNFAARGVPFPPEIYAEDDARFAALAAASPAAHEHALPQPAPEEARRTPAQRLVFTGVLDLNTASATELERLPRVGPALAGRIVAHREANGAFGSVDELRRVKGIGAKTLEVLRPHVRVAP